MSEHHPIKWNYPMETPPTPRALTREEVENHCNMLADANVDWPGRGSLSEALLAHDAAQRRTIEQQAQEVERLDKDLGAERVRGNFYKAEIDRSDALLNQFGIPNIAHECGDMLKPVDERIELVFVRMDTINQQLAAMTTERDKWRRIRTPTHGNCCTCQQCGVDHDSCRCDLDDVCDELDQARKHLTASEQEATRLREQLNDAVCYILHGGQRPNLVDIQQALTGQEGEG